MNEENLNEIKQIDWGNLKPSQIVAIDFLIERLQELERGKSPDARQVVLEGLYAENKRYRELLESIRYTQDIAKEIQVEKPNIKVITPDDLLQHILRKVNKELEETEDA